MPLVWAGELYQAQYPLLCSDRYLIVEATLAAHATAAPTPFAHGCTGMGNDQVRFDLAVQALGDYEIVAPIREIQTEHTDVRAYEQKYLEAARLRGARQAEGVQHQREPARADHLRRRDRPLGAPGEDARGWCAPRGAGPRSRCRRACASIEGVPSRSTARRWPARSCSRNSTPSSRIRRRPRHLHRRHHHRPQGPHRLRVPRHHGAPGGAPRARGGGAQRAAERFKPVVAQKWVELVYEGFFFEPLKTDLEAFLASLAGDGQRRGRARDPRRRVDAVAVRSPHILNAAGASTRSRPTGAWRKPRASSSCSA